MTKDNKIEYEEKTIDIYNTIKTKLKSILRNKHFLDTIKKRVYITNEIWSETYFLVNMIVLDMLKKNEEIYMDYSLIERCVLFVLKKQDKMRKSKKFNDKKANMEYMLDKIKNIYDKYYVQLGNNELDKYSKIKSIGKPFEYLSRQIITNIKNHVENNFMKFQNIYLKNKYKDFFDENKISKNMRKSIISFIQKKINNQEIKHRYTFFKTAYIKDPNLYVKLIKKTAQIIVHEENIIPDKLKNNIDANFMESIRYFFIMNKYLESKELKRFTILPQLSLKDKYIKFDSRLISSVYCEWLQDIDNEIQASNEKYIKDTYNDKFAITDQLCKKIADMSTDIFKLLKKKLSHEEIMDIHTYKVNNNKFIRTKYQLSKKDKIINIKLFEKNYLEEYKRLFNFDKMYKDNRSNNFTPISFMTNGYSVCVLFTKEKTINIPIKTGVNKKQKIKKVIEKVDLNNYQKNKKIKKGIFDANNCVSSENFLDKFHKIGIDPGNNVILYCQSETGKVIRIKKSYYNNISHITHNTKKMKKYLKQNDMKNIYEEMSKTNYKKTCCIDTYIKYIKLMRNNKEKLVDFYRQNKVQSLELNTYIHKKKAIHTIVRKIIPKNNKIHKFDSYKNKYIDDNLYEKVKKLPILLAFGKGNGSITINNLRNSSGKGPIKTLAFELGKHCLTILTDEYNTSKYCSCCTKKKLIHPTVQKEIYRTHQGIKVPKIVNHEVYRLCYCQNKTHPENTSIFGVHKIWNRDYNASKNILTVMKNKLLCKKLGVFNRTT